MIPFVHPHDNFSCWWSTPCSSHSCIFDNNHNLLKTKLVATYFPSNTPDYLDVTFSMISGRICRCCCSCRSSRTLSIQLENERCGAFFYPKKYTNFRKDFNFLEVKKLPWLALEASSNAPQFHQPHFVTFVLNLQSLLLQSLKNIK